MALAALPKSRAPRSRDGLADGAPLALIASGSLYQMGGMERVMQTVARELVCHGFRTEVVVPQQPIASEMRDWFGQYGASVVISDELAQMSASGFRAVP